MNQMTEIVDSQELQHYSKAQWAERLAVCRRRFRLILYATVATSAGAILWSFLQLPVYEAKATLLINREPKLIQTDIGYMPESAWDYQATQFEIMKSSAVLVEALRRLNFTHEPSHASPIEQMLGIVLPLVFQGRSRQAESGSSEEIQRKMIQSFHRSITIKPVQGTRLVEIVVQAGDPEFAARAANVLAALYIDQSLETKLHVSQYAAQWFAARLKETREKVEESERALYAYQAKYGFTDTGTQPSLVEQRLAELNADLVKAELKRAEAQTFSERLQSAFRHKSDAPADQFSLFLRATGAHKMPLIQPLLEEEQKQTREISKLSKRFSSLHPTVKRARSELEGLQTQIKNELRYAFENDYKNALAQERMLREALERLKTEKQGLDGHLVEYYVLDREAKINRQLYDSLLKQVKEADISAEFKLNNILLTDPAVPLFDPIRPRKALNTIVGLLLGLMSGIGLAFSRESLDRNIKGPEDLDRHLPELACFGLVPFVPKKRKEEIALFPLGPAAESYRGIRTSVILSSADQHPRSLLITSAGPNEGKSTLATNLAIAMAQLEKNPVILIDADLRKPRLGQMFPIKAQKKPHEESIGLVHYLMGKAKIEEIVQSSNHPYLFVIHSGMIPSNPSELLHSTQMAALLKQFHDKHYQVIVDAPPVLPVADSIVLGRQVDGVILVVSARETCRETCRLAVKRLTTSGANVLGVILQKVREEDLPPYYHARSANDRAG